MRTIHADEIKQTIKNLISQASFVISPDVTAAVAKALTVERSPLGRDVLRSIQENNRIACSEQLAICQDTGMVIVFAEVGQELYIDGSFEGAINDGTREAYDELYLRKSIVTDPLFDRKNTGDNTPAIIYTTLTTGDKLSLTVVLKGFGSENMSKTAMLTPSQGRDGVFDFVLETVRQAGPNPCPPIVVGVGIGGSFDKSAQLAKLATVRSLGSAHEDSRYAELERELLTAINTLGIGPAGTGGRTTALGVNILTHPTHIASLPVAVNICCHATRHAQAVL